MVKNGIIIVPGSEEEEPSMEMQTKYWIAYDFMDDEWNGEVLAVTADKRRALAACHEREDDTDGECATMVKAVESLEEALRIAKEAAKRGDKPMVEVA